MADIELVIKIPEEIRLALINIIQLSMDQQSICDSYIHQAIINGTPLPKGHGRLIDADELDVTTVTTDDYSGNEVLDVVLKDDIDDAPTIIEADKAGSEE